jgi:hypothetical protein
MGTDILLIAVRLPYQRLEVIFSFHQAAESCQAVGLIEEGYMKFFRQSEIF